LSAVITTEDSSGAGFTKWGHGPYDTKQDSRDSGGREKRNVKGEEDLTLVKGQAILNIAPSMRSLILVPAPEVIDQLCVSFITISLVVQQRNIYSSNVFSNPGTP
jgi:hypothetical protein